MKKPSTYFYQTPPEEWRFLEALRSYFIDRIPLTTALELVENDLITLMIARRDLYLSVIDILEDLDARYNEQERTDTEDIVAKYADLLDEKCWRVNNVNLTEILHTYKHGCMEKILNDSALTELEELAVNDIIYIDRNNEGRYNCARNVWNMAIEEMGNSFPDEVSPKYDEIDEILEISKTDWREAEMRTLTELTNYAERDDNDGSDRFNLLYTLMRTFRKNNNTPLSDGMYTSQTVINILAVFLNTDGQNVELENGGRDEPLEEREERDEADLIVVVKSDNYTASPFICIINGPVAARSRPSEFLNLCAFIKKKLDQMPQVDEKVVYGLLVEGYEAKIYVMDLLYYKTCRLKLLHEFRFPSCMVDIDLIKPCFDQLDCFQKCLQTTTNILLRQLADLM